MSCSSGKCCGCTSIKVYLNVAIYSLAYYFTRDAVAAVTKAQADSDAAATALLAPYLQYAMMAGVLLCGMVHDCCGPKNSLLLTNLASAAIYAAGVIALNAEKGSQLALYAVIAMKAGTTLQHTMAAVSMWGAVSAPYTPGVRTEGQSRQTNALAAVLNSSAAYGVGVVVGGFLPPFLVSLNGGKALTPNTLFALALFETFVGAIAITSLPSAACDDVVAAAPAPAKGKGGKAVAAAAPKKVNLIAFLFSPSFIQILLFTFAVRYGAFLFGTFGKAYSTAGNALVIPKDFAVNPDYALMGPVNLFVLPIVYMIFGKNLSLFASLLTVFAVGLTLAYGFAAPALQPVAAFVGIGQIVVKAGLGGAASAMIGTSIPRAVGGRAFAVAAVVSSSAYTYAAKVQELLVAQLTPLLQGLKADQLTAVAIAGLLFVALIVQPRKAKAE